MKRGQQCFLFFFVLKEETKLGTPTRDTYSQKEVAGCTSQPHIRMQVFGCSESHLDAFPWYAKHRELRFVNTTCKQGKKVSW